jgi:hypothetical protein
VTPEVQRTASFELATSGAAYGTFYATSDATVRAPLVAAATAAREAGLGVWARDASGEFELRSQASIGRAGALILPKLFRRCSDYLRADARETLPAWLRRRRGEPNSPDDEVLADGDVRHLSDLLTQEGARISFTADPLELLFLD